MKTNLKFVQILESKNGALLGLTKSGACYVKSKWGWVRFSNDDTVITEAELLMFQQEEPKE